MLDLSLLNYTTTWARLACIAPKRLTLDKCLTIKLLKLALARLFRKRYLSVVFITCFRVFNISRLRNIEKHHEKFCFFFCLKIRYIGCFRLKKTTQYFIILLVRIYKLDLTNNSRSNFSFVLFVLSIFTLRLNQTQGIFYLASKLSSEIEKIKSIFESFA